MATHVRTCQKCGCTDQQACAVEGPPGGDIWVGCHWVGEAQCSACYPEPECLCEDHLPSHPEVAAHFKQVAPEDCFLCRLLPKG